MLKNPTVIAAVIGAVAVVAAALIGRGDFSPEPIIEPTLEKKTKSSADALVRPGSEPTAETQPDLVVAPPLLEPEPVSFRSCESIDRSRQDVLRDTIGDMISRNRTSLEIDDFKRQYDSLRAVDCGYVKNLSRKGQEIGASLGKAPEEALHFVVVICVFDKTWDSKLVTHDRTRRVALEGIIDAEGPGLDAIWLEDCRILQVE